MKRAILKLSAVALAIITLTLGTWLSAPKPASAVEQYGNCCGVCTTPTSSWLYPYIGSGCAGGNCTKLC